MRRALLAALGAALVLVAPAPSYTVAGTPWPVTRITVWNDTPYRAPVADAMAAWNAVGTRVRFAAATSRASARLVVTLLPSGGAGASVGLGTLGWAPTAQAQVQVRAGLGARLASAVVAHELGHVLGLGHEPRGCALMSASLESERPGAGCRIARCAKVDECLVQSDDANGLRDLYERRLPALRPQALRDVSARPVRSGQPHLQLAWTSPLGGPGAAVLVRAERGRCPSTPYGAPLERTGSVTLIRGVAQTAALPIAGAGRWCVGLWVQETSSFLTGPASYVRLTVR